VDGKALRGSVHLDQPRRHLLSAVTHGRPVTVAQAEVGSKTNEVRHFRPLLAPLDLDGEVVTFDALHTVKANVTWLVEVKKAHYAATAPSPKTPPPSTPVTHPAPWPPSATSPSAPSKPSERPTSPRPPAPSATNHNEPSPPHPGHRPRARPQRNLIRPWSLVAYDH
jgi:predicted transposase YbfD/YdcC